MMTLFSRMSEFVRASATNDAVKALRQAISRSRLRDALKLSVLF